MLRSDGTFRRHSIINLSNQSSLGPCLECYFCDGVRCLSEKALIGATAQIMAAAWQNTLLSFRGVLANHDGDGEFQTKRLMSRTMVMHVVLNICQVHFFAVLCKTTTWNDKAVRLFKERVPQWLIFRGFLWNWAVSHIFSLSEFLDRQAYSEQI